MAREAEIIDWLKALFAAKGRPNVTVKLKQEVSREAGFPQSRRSQARLYRAEVHVREDDALSKAVEDEAREMLPAAGGIEGAELRAESAVTYHFNVLHPVPESPSGYSVR